MELLIGAGIAAIVIYSWLGDLKGMSRSTKAVAIVMVTLGIVGMTGVLGPTYAWFGD